MLRIHSPMCCLTYQIVTVLTVVVFTCSGLLSWQLLQTGRERCDALKINIFREVIRNNHLGGTFGGVALGDTRRWQ